ncbi:MAG: hypothetical protein LBS70_07490 [Candidatus Accumulibacter sp.]|jgi:hypothetical protein|nr:hypothetical protein [Accumulibacter sp.]
MDRATTRRLEFPLAVAIIGVLGALLINFLLEVRDEYEAAAMQSEAAALRVYLLERLARREAVGGPLPESRNPLAWIDYAPPNYVGERAAAPGEGHVWYYDTRREELIYRYRNGREARYRLARGTVPAPAGTLGGIGLARVDGQ